MEVIVAVQPSRRPAGAPLPGLGFSAGKDSLPWPKIASAGQCRGFGRYLRLNCATIMVESTVREEGLGYARCR